jgi:hypothetical protein
VLIIIYNQKKRCNFNRNLSKTNPNSMNQFIYRNYFLFVILIFGVSGCLPENDIAPSEQRTNPSANKPDPVPSSNAPWAKKFSADKTIAWMDLTYKLVAREKLSPPIASRLYAYMGITTYEATINGMPNNVSLVGKLNGLTSMPVPNPKKLDWPTVHNKAFAHVLKTLLNTTNTGTHNAIDSLYNVQLASRQTEVSASLLTASVNYGAQVGNAIINYSTGDNYAATRGLVYAIPARTSNASFWAPTDADQLKPLEPYWGTLRPFALQSSDEAFIANPEEFSTVPGSAFYSSALEVKETRTNLTQEQKNIALFWADNPGQTGTPPGHWVSIMNQLASVRNLTMDEAAQMYALICISLGDAFISCWDSKYKVNLLRPKTYIREYLGDAAWEPFIKTPPFPEYTSGHSVCSGAAAYILTEIFGNVSFTDNTNNALFSPRTFSTFKQAAQEAAVSRLYGGIHFRPAIEVGVQQGEWVGEKVMTYIDIKIKIK